MSNIAFLADAHFNHRRILKYCNRSQFMSKVEIDLMDMAEKGLINDSEIEISQESCQKMDDWLIDQINAKVAPNDTLWYLGDFCIAPRHIYKETARVS